MSIHGNLSNHMISGRVKVKSNVEDFVEIAAIFEDGSTVKNIDRSFFCHGLHLLISFLWWLFEYHWWPSISISFCILTSFGKINFGFHWLNPMKSSGNTNNRTPVAGSAMCLKVWECCWMSSYSFSATIGYPVPEEY